MGNTGRAGEHGGFAEVDLRQLRAMEVMTTSVVDVQIGQKLQRQKNLSPSALLPVPYCLIRPSEALAAHRNELRQLISRYNVTHPCVFGSVLAGNDEEESDLDLLVDPTEHTSLFTFGGLQDEAQQLLGAQVSVLTPKGLPVKFRDKVLQTAQPL